MENEIWKPVVGCEGFYEVSNLGNIVSLNYNKTKKRKPFIPTQNGYGYLQAHFFGNKKRKRILVHRAVLMAFVGENKLRPHCNHINDIKTDNRLENLEWVIMSENMIHAEKTD